MNQKIVCLLRSNIEWAWKNDQEIIIDQNIISIKIKRKRHLLSHVTTESIIEKNKINQK